MSAKLINKKSPNDPGMQLDGMINTRWTAGLEKNKWETHFRSGRNGQDDEQECRSRWRCVADRQQQEEEEEEETRAVPAVAATTNANDWLPYAQLVKRHDQRARLDDEAEITRDEINRRKTTLSSSCEREEKRGTCWLVLISISDKILRWVSSPSPPLSHSLCLSVSLFVCVCIIEQDNSKSCNRISMK